MRDTIVNPDRQRTGPLSESRRIGAQQRGTQRHRPTPIPPGDRTDPARAPRALVGQPAGRFRCAERGHRRHRRRRRRQPTNAAAVTAPIDRPPAHPGRDRSGQFDAARDHRRADHRAGRPVRRRSSSTARAPAASAAGTGDRRPAAPTVARISTSASYRSTISPVDTCLASPTSRRARSITVVNLNNGHSVTCIATPRVLRPPTTGLIMHTDTFAQIADLTDAPIPVEISQ